MPARTSATLIQVMELIREGQTAARERFDDLRADFDAKHLENRDRRHAQAGEMQLIKDQHYLLATRVSNVETTLLTIVGDNSGGSGLLHSIDKKVDKLQEDFSSWKTEIKDTPAIRKWVYGAMAVAALIGTLIVAVIGAGTVELLKALLRH